MHVFPDEIISLTLSHFSNSDLVSLVGVLPGRLVLSRLFRNLTIFPDSNEYTESFSYWYENRREPEIRFRMAVMPDRVSIAESALLCRPFSEFSPYVKNLSYFNSSSYKLSKHVKMFLRLLELSELSILFTNTSHEFSGFPKLSSVDFCSSRLTTIKLKNCVENSEGLFVFDPHQFPHLQRLSLSRFDLQIVGDGAAGSCLERLEVIEVAQLSLHELAKIRTERLQFDAKSRDIAYSDFGTAMNDVTSVEILRMGKFDGFTRVFPSIDSFTAKYSDDVEPAVIRSKSMTSLSLQRSSEGQSMGLRNDFFLGLVNLKSLNVAHYTVPQLSTIAEMLLNLEELVLLWCNLTEMTSPFASRSLKELRITSDASSMFTKFPRVLDCINLELLKLECALPNSKDYTIKVVNFNVPKLRVLHSSVAFDNYKFLANSSLEEIEASFVPDVNCVPTSLKHLSLVDLVNFDMSCLKSFINIEILNLSGTHGYPPYIDVSEIKPLHKLQSLTLSKIDFEVLDGDYLRDMPDLRSLKVEFTSDPFVIRNICNLPLTKIDFSRCAITGDLDIHDLKNLKSLLVFDNSLERAQSSIVFEGLPNSCYVQVRCNILANFSY